jgi:transcriptional regulator with GAF, ATPase, and Fis domain
MEKPRVWHHTFDQYAAASSCAAVEELTAAGIKLGPFDADEPCHTGLLFFGEITQPFCEFVREVSRNGLVRILAITTAQAPPPSGDTWQLLRCGASDVLRWSACAEPARQVAARLERWSAVDRLVNSPLVRNNLVGRSRAWIAMLRQVVELASFTDSPVLIVGESGTGKELVARLVHSLDPRPRKRDLVVLDCTTVVRELSGSEFFGHERGAYTGATGPRDGAFALAHRGTLFLDEVGELPPPLQAQLLRVVQEGTYKRVGGNAWNSTEFRLVCATNRELLADVAAGRFRADLYYRIASVICSLPPLRDRPEDVLPLFHHFLAELRPDTEPPELDEPVREYLLRREYPGNVRDLKQLAARVAYRHVGPGPITVGDLPENERPAGSVAEESWRDAAFETSIRRALARGVGLKEIGKLATESAIRIALDEEEGNLQRAAQLLGVTDRALQMRKAASRQSEPTLGHPQVN